MSEEQNSFIIGATQLVEELLEKLAGTTDAQTIEDARTRIAFIVRDIRRSLEGVEATPDTNDDRVDLAVVPCCSSCYPSYVSCIVAGKGAAYCLNQYNICRVNCNPNC